MVVDRAILQISTDNTKLTLPHRILFSGDARICFPGLDPTTQKQSPFVYLLVHYIFS